ncbi:ACT domain-containing protein [Caldithrix abyssi]|nr:ACT domain-containing protein [Caldithrix abyssi]
MHSKSMSKKALTLSVLPDEFAVCRLRPDDDIPDWGYNQVFCSITRAADELSVICLTKDVPTYVHAERNWRVLKVEGPLDFSLTGILACLAGPLADAKLSIFAISTFNTDYMLIRAGALERAVAVLQDEGHTVNW